MIPETKPDHELSDGLRKETQDPEWKHVYTDPLPQY